MYNEAEIEVYPRGPEIAILGFLDSMELQARLRRIQLEVEGRVLHSFLLLAGKAAETVGEGDCDPEMHGERSAQSIISQLYPEADPER